MPLQCFVHVRAVSTAILCLLQKVLVEIAFTVSGIAIDASPQLKDK